MVDYKTKELLERKIKDVSKLKKYEEKAKRRRGQK